jgi:uncharacterized protein YbdZ (MbtH family)
MGTGEREAIYKVVVDHEGQHSIWPADRENPLGWSDVGQRGTEQECEDYIKAVGTKKEAEHLAPDETGGERGDL